MKNKTLEREWTIEENQLEVAYLHETMYKAGKMISLPLTKKQENDLFSLIRKSSTGASTKDCRKNCSVENGRLIIAGLEEGNYELHWFRMRRTVEFSVCKGETWEKQNQIYNKANRTISETPQNLSHYTCLQEPEIKEEGDYAYISFAINKGENIS